MKTTIPPIRFRRRPLLAGLLVALIAVGCSAGDPANDQSEQFAADVIADVALAMDQPTTTLPPEGGPSIEVPEGCVLVEELDEYGFPIDVVRCDGEAPVTTTQGLDISVEDWVGSDDAANLSAAIRDALVIQTSCGDVSELASLNDLVAATPDEVRQPLSKAAAELAQAALFCNLSPEAWQDHMDLAIAYLQEFVSAIARETRS